MTKQPAKGGRRLAAPAGSAPQISMTAAEMQAMIAAAVAAALQTQAPAASPVQPVAVEEADNETDYQAEQVRKRLAVEKQAQVAIDVMSTMIEPRFLEIFQWLARGQGKTDAQLIRELLRKGLIEWKAAHREAMGEGGMSSRNIEVLSERLQPKA